MTEIAPDFGMSDVAFAKHCKRLNVPIPWRGYWQRIVEEEGSSQDSQRAPPTAKPRVAGDFTRP
jgi:hypothetical protein